MVSIFTRRRTIVIAAAFIITLLLYIDIGAVLQSPTQAGVRSSSRLQNSKFRWENLPVRFPVASLIPLPDGQPERIPRIQFEPLAVEPIRAKERRIHRKVAVRRAFQHAWAGYKEKAWMADEVGPLSGRPRNSFGGWAATLVDALDTLWIMGMKEDFEFAVNATAAIDFTQSDENTINTFETTIRYLGGFLAAYDISERQYPQLLAKAYEVGEMLLVAFDTPNRMPITRWDWRRAARGETQEAHDNVLLAEIGSLTLEFTRLSELTGDGRFYDAVQRVMNQFDNAQMTTRLPGMWPIVMNAREVDFGSDNAFTIGSMADSAYEYLPKAHLLLGGRTNQYRDMYNRAADVFTAHNFYRPMTPDDADILFSGLCRVGNTSPILDNSMQHLVCFAGGMVGLASKIFDRPNDLPIAKQLVDGCIWLYDSMPNGLMAEISHHIACPSVEDCTWNETLWHEEIMKLDHSSPSRLSFAERVQQKIEREKLPPGYTSISDRRYILRPEAVESIFIWYRMTGDHFYQDHAYRIFERIQNHTQTDIANAALDDVTASPPTKADRMESFWMAETLKYLFLTFEVPHVVSLDDYVFSTEAHPFRRPGR